MMRAHKIVVGLAVGALVALSAASSFAQVKGTDSKEGYGYEFSDDPLSAGGFGRTLDEVSARIDQLIALGVTRTILSPLPEEQLLALAEGLQSPFGMEM